MVFRRKEKEQSEAVSKEVAKPAAEPSPPAPKRTRKSPGARYPLEVKLTAVRANKAE